MRLNFISSFQNQHDYEVVGPKHSVRITLSYDTGRIRFQDYGNILNTYDRHMVYCKLLSMYRLNRRQLHEKHKQTPGYFDSEVVKKIYLDSIAVSRRIHRNNQDLH